jgi:hypothetical protein
MHIQPKLPLADRAGIVTSMNVLAEKRLVIKKDIACVVAQIEAVNRQRP